jgi:hypothetical protein
VAVAVERIGAAEDEDAGAAVERGCAAGDVCEADTCTAGDAGAAEDDAGAAEDDAGAALDGAGATGRGGVEAGAPTAPRARAAAPA